MASVKARAGGPGAGAPGLFKRGLADSAGVLVAPKQLAGNECLAHAVPAHEVLVRAFRSNLPNRLGGAAQAGVSRGDGDLADDGAADRLGVGAISTAHVVKVVHVLDVCLEGARLEHGRE